MGKASGGRYPGIIIYRAKNRRKKTENSRNGLLGLAHALRCVILREKEKVLFAVK
jgi:hypothetical protein